MTGFLVINHYLKGKKYDELHNHLVKSAKKCDITLKIVTNQQIIFNSEKPDFVLFWDKDVNTAKMIENRGIPVFNSASSIELCDNKAKTYLALESIVPQPETIIAPLSFFECDYSEFIDLAAEKLGLPLVYKECYGSFGEQVFLCNTKEEIKSHINGKLFLLQKFIAESKGRDRRIEIINGQCAAAMLRENKNDFRSNITNGGTAVPYSPTKSEIETCVKACGKLGLTFGGVDMLEDGSVCEVNSNAHIINLTNTVGIDVAPLIFETIRCKL